jgi:Flp pilus assembly protein TadD
MQKRTVNAVVSPMLTAWALAGSGLTAPALEALSPLAQFDGFKAVHAFHAGLILDLGGKTDAALDQYKIALAGPLNIRTIEAAGSAYQRRGDSQAAADLYARYASEHPETLLFDGTSLLATGKDAQLAVTDAKEGMAEAMFDLTQVLRQTEQAQLAMIYNRLALILEPDFPLAQMTMADLLTASGHVREANQILRSISPKSPVSAFARLRLAANLDDKGKSDEALKELSTLEAERPNNVEVRITEGDIYRRRKEFHSAAQAYTQALALIKGQPAETWSIYFSRGVALERDHQWPEAEADLQQALRMRPDQPDVMNYLAYSWIDRGQNLAEARAMIERAVRLRPDDGAIVDSLGWALFRLGDFGGAVKMLERAVELKPEDPTINEHLGDAYWKVGRQSEARMQWNRASSMEPEPEQLPALTEKVRTGVLPESSPAQ